MIVAMRWWPIVATLGACESARDFPAPPNPLEWHAIELAVHRGKLDGTEYQVELPRGAQEVVIGSKARFSVYGLDVTIELDQEARTLDEVDAALTDDMRIRDDGWSGHNSSGVLNYVYVDEGGLLCTATAAMPSSDQRAHMGRICGSLRATSALANPRTYPDGLSPSRVRAAMCQLAMHHVRGYENVGRLTKSRKTKQERAADAAREEKLDAAYSDRQARCERRRWSMKQTQCLVQVRSVEEAIECVPDW